MTNKRIFLHIKGYKYLYLNVELPINVQHIELLCKRCKFGYSQLQFEKDKICCDCKIELCEIRRRKLMKQLNIKDEPYDVIDIRKYNNIKPKHNRPNYTQSEVWNKGDF